MKRSPVMTHYAAALFHASEDADVADQIETELGELVELTQAQPQLEALWRNPQVPKDVKHELAQKLLGKAHPFVQNFVRLLIDRHRTGYLADIFREFKDVRDRESDTTHVVVTTAFELTKTLQDKIKKRLDELIHRDIRVSLVEDPSLLGGIRVKIHDDQVDGSLVAKLDGLRRSLLENI